MKKHLLGPAWRGYLRSRWKILLLMGAFIAIFALICTLLGAPLAGVGYASLLCLALGLVVTLVDFWHCFCRHTALSKLLQGTLCEADPLPAAQGLLENDYRALLCKALADHAQISAQNQSMQKAQNDYYSLWTHQVKVPIAAMKLLLQSNPAEQNAALNAELFKIEQYVDMALSYVRLNSDASDYVLKGYPLNPLLKQAVRKFAPLFIQKKLKVHIDESSFMVLTDEKWLSFVIEQLLSNAIKYTKHGCITLRANPQDETLCIVDTGIGIAPEDLPRVFEQGYTGYNGRSDKRATGLGLYLVKQVLQRLSHTISITSEVGRGTCVAIGFSHVELHAE
ncbi:MAG: sensor histidine kinase [Clostridia bacterium]